MAIPGKTWKEEKPIKRIIKHGSFMSCGALGCKAIGHALERQSRLCLKIAPQECRETEAGICQIMSSPGWGVGRLCLLAMKQVPVEKVKNPLG